MHLRKKNVSYCKGSKKSLGCRKLSLVIRRKNWLFMSTAKGARASAIIYSIIETANANNLQVEKYLTYLMEYLANTEIKTEEVILPVMPWSSELPQNLKIRTSEK